MEITPGLDCIETPASTIGKEYDFGKKYFKCRKGKIPLNHLNIEAHEVAVFTFSSLKLCYVIGLRIKFSILKFLTKLPHFFLNNLS